MWQWGSVRGLLTFHAKQIAFLFKNWGSYFEISFSGRSRGPACSPGRGSWARDSLSIDFELPANKVIIWWCTTYASIQTTNCIQGRVERFFKLKLLHAAATSGPSAVQSSCGGLSAFCRRDDFALSDFKRGVECTGNGIWTMVRLLTFTVWNKTHHFEAETFWLSFMLSSRLWICWWNSVSSQTRCISCCHIFKAGWF